LHRFNYFGFSNAIEGNFAFVAITYRSDQNSHVTPLS